MLHLQSLLDISNTVPRKEPPPPRPSRFPLWSPNIEKDVPSPEASLRIFKSPQKINCHSGFRLRSPYIEKDIQSPEPSLHIFKVPRKEAAFQVPFSEPHRNRRSVPRTLLYLSLAVPSERAPPPPLQVPHQGPNGERCSSPGPAIHASQNSQ
jgi:hypothetical protein